MQNYEDLTIDEKEMIGILIANLSKEEREKIIIDSEEIYAEIVDIDCSLDIINISDDDSSWKIEINI
jgi:hypothetical protein